MEIIYFLLPLALLIAIGFVVAYVWAIYSGQYDDLDTPPYRVLLDDESAQAHDKSHS